LATDRNPHIDVQRAMQAEELLNNPLLSEALDSMEREYLAAWRASKLPDLEERERLWLAMQVLEQMRNHLRIVLENGVVARREIDRIAGRR
jgi:hypothetical protein